MDRNSFIVKFLHASGALMAIPTAEILIAFVALYYFRRGRWRHVEV